MSILQEANIQLYAATSIQAPVGEKPVGEKPY